MARETVALQEIIPDTTLIVAVARERQPPFIGKWNFHLGFAVRDVDDVIAVIVDRADGEFAFFVEGPSGKDASLNLGTRVARHRHKKVVVSLLDFVEIADSVLNSCDVLVGGRGWGRDLFIGVFVVFAQAWQAHAVWVHVWSFGLVSGILAQFGAPLQDDRLKSIGRHANIVAVDKRRVVALSSDSNVQTLKDTNISVKFAKDGIPFLARPEEQSSIPVVRSIDRLRRITGYSERDMVEKVICFQP